MEETKRLLEVRDENECLKLIIDFMNDAKARYAPALDHFTPEGIESAAKKFMFEEVAKHKLDEEARAEGYLHAADRVFKQARAAREAEAKARAKEAAKLKAEQDEKDRQAKEAAEKALALQRQRDEEDALLAAKVKAAQKALQLGSEAAANV